MFGFNKKKTPLFPYDPALHTPVILSSICTGEKTVGFQDKSTHKFHPCNKVVGNAEIAQFAKDYHIDAGSIKTIY